MATFGYGRVSTGQQTADNQFVEITQAGYEIEPEFWFADEGVSGKVCAELPLCDLGRVHIELLRQFGQRALALDCRQSHFRFERR